MKNLFTYPGDSGTYFINSTHIGDGTFGLSYRVNEFLQGEYLAHEGLDPVVDLSQTWQILTPELSKYIEYFDDNKLLTNLSQYDFWNTPLVVVDTATNTWTVNLANTNYNEFNDTGSTSTFYTSTDHALWWKIQLEMSGLTGDWSTLNGTKFYGYREGDDEFKLFWDEDITDAVDFYWQKKETGVTTTVTDNNPIIFNQTGHDLIESMPINASQFDGTMSYLQQNDAGTPYTYYVKNIDADSFKLTTDAAGTIELTPDLGPQDVNISSLELTSGNHLEITLPSGTDNLPDGSRVRELNGVNLSAEEFGFPDKTYDYPQAVSGTTHTLRAGKHCFTTYGDKMLQVEIDQISQTNNYTLYLAVYEYDQDNNEWDLLTSVSPGSVEIISLPSDATSIPSAISGDGNIIMCQITNRILKIYEWDGVDSYDEVDTITLTYPDWFESQDIQISEDGSRFVVIEGSAAGQDTNVRVYVRSGDDWSIEQTLYSLDTYSELQLDYYNFEDIGFNGAGDALIIKHVLPYTDSENGVGNSLTSALQKQFAYWTRSGSTWTNQNFSLYQDNWSYGLVKRDSGQTSFYVDTSEVYTTQNVDYVNDIGQHLHRRQIDYIAGTDAGTDNWVAYCQNKCDMNADGDAMAFGGVNLNNTNEINFWIYDTSWASHNAYTSTDSGFGDNFRLIANTSNNTANVVVDTTSEIHHANVGSYTGTIVTISDYTKNALTYPLLGARMDGLARGYNFPDIGMKANGKIFKLEFAQMIFNQMVSTFNTAGDLWLKTTATDDVYTVHPNETLTGIFGWQQRPILTTANGGAGQGSYDNNGNDMDISIGYPTEDSTTGIITEVYDRDADGNTIALFTEPVDFSGTATVAPHADEQHPRYAQSLTLHLGGNKQFSRLDANGDPETSINWTQWYEPGNTDPESASVRPEPGTAFEATVNHTVDTDYRIATSTLGTMAQRGAYKTDETEFCLNLYSEEDLFSSVLPDNGEQWMSFSDDSRKQWPNDIAPANVEIVYNMPASVTRNPIGTKYALPSGRYKWSIVAEYPPLTQEQFVEMQTVANAVSGVAMPFHYFFKLADNKWLWDYNTSSTDFIRFRKEEIDKNTDNVIEKGLKTFLVDGFEGSETDAFNAGEVIHLEDNINGGLNTVVNQVDANVFGEARISIASPLEFDHFNGELIDKDPTNCVVTLADNKFEYTKRTDGFYEVTVTFNLDKFED